MREEFLAYNATVQLLWQRRVLINYLSCAVYNLQTAVLFTLLYNKSFKVTLLEAMITLATIAVNRKY